MDEKSSRKIYLGGAIRPGDYLSTAQLLALGLQHTFTMFGATVLVPLLTGIDVKCLQYLQPGSGHYGFIL